MKMAGSPETGPADLDELLRGQAPGAWVVLDHGMTGVLGTGDSPEAAMVAAGLPVAMLPADTDVDTNALPVMVMVPGPPPTAVEPPPLRISCDDCAVVLSSDQPTYCGGCRDDVVEAAWDNREDSAAMVRDWALRAWTTGQIDRATRDLVAKIADDIEVSE